MQNWDDLKFCLALQRYETMTAAARALDTNTATVSRRIDKLTTQLGVQLFTRNGQHWQATEFAKRLVAVAEAFEYDLTHAQSTAQDSHQNQQLRISTELTILQGGLVNVLKELIPNEPKVNFEVSMRTKSLAFGETDIAVSYAKPEDGRVVRVKVKTVAFHAFVDSKFQNQVDGWIDILDQDDNSNWSEPLREHFGCPPKIKGQGLSVARQLMANLPLAAMMPQVFADRFGDLSPFEGLECTELPIWLSYHESRRHDPLVRNTVSQLIEAMRAE